MNNHKSTTYFLCSILSILCLILGGIVYLVYRTRTLLMFHFLSSDCISILDSAKTTVNIPNNTFTSFVVYSLPAALWTISYILFMHLICIDMPKIARLIWIYSLPILLCLVEFLQILPVISGTFDIIDVLCYIIPIIVSLLIDIRNEKL